MNKGIRIIAALSLLLIAGALATAGAELPAAADDTARPVWVFLDGKAEGESAWDEARARLSEGALARRARLGAGASLVGERDLALHPKHLARIRSMGFEIRAESRWFSAVSLEADAKGVARLESLPFVRLVRPIPPSRALPRVDGPSVPMPVPGEGLRGRIDYGGSLAELEQINIPAVHQLGYHGEGIVVGILDTGADLSHVALQGVSVLGAWDFINDDGVISDEAGDPQGQDDHGTTTLSTIAGYAPGGLVGGAYGASFYLAKTEITDSESPIEEDYWVEGIEWLEASGCDIVTSSLSYDDWYVYSDLDGNTALCTIAADEAAALGLVVFTSIGNTRFDTGYLTAPADGDSVIAMGALTADGEYAWFSAPGPSYDGRIKPDLMALGVDNHVVNPNSTNSYMLATGTSYPSPLAASVAAMVLQANPGISAMAVRDAMRETASRAAAPNNDYGWGVINALAAIRYFHPHIEHEPLPDSEDTVSGYPIEATIYLPETSISDTWLFYRVDGAAWDSLPLLPQGGNLYTTTLPAQPWGSQVDYYLRASCELGWTTYHPADAPTSWHVFHVDQDLTPPVIVHQPLLDVPIMLWPATVSAEVTDNLGLEQVWCEYRWNSVVQEPFDLAIKVGGTYEAEFPFAAEVGDSIHYRILARDQATEPNTAVDPPSGEHAFQVIEVPGLVLLLEDAVSLRGSSPKGDEALRLEGPPRARSTSADLMEGALVSAGFEVERQLLAVSDPATWLDYHILAITCGDLLDPLTPAGIPAALITHIARGGRLLIEGGEIAYTFSTQTSFLSKVLHVSAWQSDNGGGLQLAAPEHPVAQTPNALPALLPLGYGSYGDQDVVLPIPEATAVYDTEQNPGSAGILAYDDDPAPQAGQLVYLPMNLGALDPESAAALVQNAASWLVAGQAPGQGALGGHCELEGGADFSGIEVVLSGQPLQMTGPSGAFLFEGLWPGHYSLHAGKDGYAAVDTTFELAEGQQILDLHLFLRAMEMFVEYSYPGLLIPDYYLPGVIDSIWIGAMGELLDLSVMVNITHSYIGDLEVLLENPQGMQVMLHDRSGGAAVSIQGTYPEDLVPAEDLDLMIGQGVRGWWKMRVADCAPYDIGIFHSWGLSLGLPIFTTDTEEEPAAFALRGNWPNPFNPTTCLEFSLDAPGRARVTIYDLGGRRVARLVDEDLAAGTHSVLWHGRDQAGRTLPSGVYFARLECGGRRDLRKMLLLK